MRKMRGTLEHIRIGSHCDRHSAVIVDGSKTKNNFKEPILENMINAMGKSYHQRCFTCATCDKPFTDSFHEHEG